MTQTTSDRLLDCFAGSALGTFIGDALGMPVEGFRPADIKSRFGILDDMAAGRLPAGCYTDDTEMMIGLLESLVMDEACAPERVAKRFLANFHPERGYGGRIYALMERLSDGERWDRVGTDSFGNGAAMRTAPAGFCFYDDLDYVKKCAVNQAMITHRHPEALAGAAMQALAVALCVQANLDGRRLERELFIETIISMTWEMDGESARRLADIVTLQPGSYESMAAGIRRLYRCSVKAIESVGPAMACFLTSGDFRSAVVLAVNLGGDTDTIGAMTGALAGAYYGYHSLPEQWSGRLEDGQAGKTFIMDLCRKAAARKAERSGG